MILTLRELAITVAAGAAVLFILRCVYRLTLHPLAKYPGPLLGKLTSLRGAYYAYVGEIHLDIERCHRKYGKFVRYAPNSLLVGSTAGFHDIYGQGKKTVKQPGYSIHGRGNLLGIRDKRDFAKKKKIFQLGFSDTALRKSEPKVIEQIEIFCELMVKDAAPDGGWSSVRDMNEWCNYLTTDIICNVVFSTSWDLLTSPANRGVRSTLLTVIRMVGVAHNTWLLTSSRYAPLIFLPHMVPAEFGLRKYATEMTRRSFAARKADPTIDDFFGQFTSARDPDTGEVALSKRDVRVNSANFIIAGSDTTSSSMAAAFFYISRRPSLHARINAEVRTAFASADDIRMGPALNGCIILRAALNEAMRLCPVAPQPLWRAAEPGGCVVDGEYLPEGTLLGASIYCLHHDEAAFPDSWTYDIERWLVQGDSEEEREKDRERIKEMSKSFAPFSTGPRQCIAKNFALMELTLAMAHVFWRLDFERAPGKLGHIGEGGKGMGKGREKEGEFQFKSYFTSWLEGPMIRFKRRAL